MKYDKIFLIGFMCSGKSTLGKLLAQKLNWKFYDVDELLQQEEGMSIVEIFQEKGEDYFRRKEMEVLKKLLWEKQSVISTGGGLGANPQALHLMKENGLVLWIDIDFDTFLKRCSKDEGRPLLRKGIDFVRSLFEKRRHVYSLAHKRIDGTKDPESILREVWEFYTFTTKS